MTDLRYYKRNIAIQCNARYLFTFLSCKKNDETYCGYFIIFCCWYYQYYLPSLDKCINVKCKQSFHISNS